MKLTIPIIPKAQQRARHAVRGKHAMAYKAGSQRRAEETIKAYLLPYVPKKPLTGAICLSVMVFLPIPKSKPKWWKENAAAGRIVPTTKPDLDNLIKNIKDCLTDMRFWTDDRLVVKYGPGTGKYYSDDPRWEIEIEEVETDASRQP